MKKILAFTLITLASTAAFANQGGFTDTTSRGGFSGPTIQAMTVKQALEMHDDSKVVLKGYIEKHLGGKDYQFKDDTGTVTVEIGDRKWNGQTVSPTDLVEIYGEVDKDFTSLTIEVKQLHKVAPATK